MKMPKRGSCVYLFPNVADAGNRRIQQGELFDLGGKLRGISIGHHHADVVTDEIDIFVPEAFYKLMDIDGGSFFVIAQFFLSTIGPGPANQEQLWCSLCQSPRNNGSHAIVGMSMGLYPDTGRNRQLDRIHSEL